MSVDVDQSGGMDVEQMGPVDYLVVEFPGNRMTGEGLPLLVDLVDRGIIRILDFVFVMKDLDGSVTRSRSPTSTVTVSWIWRCSRAPRRGCWTRATSTRPGECSSRAARRGSWSTRTSGRRRSPVALRRGGGQLVASGRIRSRRCWRPRRHWTPRTPRSLTRELRDEREGENDARTSSRGGPDRGDRGYGDRGVQPGLASSGRPVGGAGAAAVGQQQQPTRQQPPAARRRRRRRRRLRHGRQAGPAQGAR